MSEKTVRIAMWSGPRNISTALLRSWGNRADTWVVDEPLYAAYLAATKREHPGRDEIIAHYENDWRKVVERLLGDPPGGKTVSYQKHMAHHLLPEMEKDWLAGLTNCILVREPREMLTSLSKVLPDPRIEDTGLPQQVEIFTAVRERTGRPPPVLDARDVLDDPRRMLALLCEAAEVSFSESMLSWPAGTRETDGIWARYWYAEVERSTGFRPYRPKDEALPQGMYGLLAECQGYYDELYRHRLGR